ncbi:glycogen/starch/alpha-glucan phosphorylase [Anaerobacillus alkaliphilus]|uniref:Alpha-1,4 glucan phosphorylase n=1 Tax=Anaerobacillus alkaliphilus TaxID=1548597 RepID=A0A4Q0VT74_9BACI|nr:glycogen/starch/alpha-glucan phosphorylase [Anaerobacillus alkaliphilus]RXJ00726.1 glycogen/starch/alpha-glucan phosphorylase [Anaerobacillus alkaliphilus]
MSFSKEEFKIEFTNRLEKQIGKNIADATIHDVYVTLGQFIREYVSRDWIETTTNYKDNHEKQVYYFSMEFLMGRLMQTNIINSGLAEIIKEGLTEMDFQLEDVYNEEHDAGLGNGGLGRLAACFLDSLASLDFPGHGCGIRYKYGLFEQKIINGYQAELPDYWLQEDYVWEVRRADQTIGVRFGGYVEMREENQKLSFNHKNFDTVLAVPYDVPVVGYLNSTVNTLRLWSAESCREDFNLLTSNRVDYDNFLEYKRSIEDISGFLYPDDSTIEGKILRLKQQYFLVSAGMQSIFKQFKLEYGNNLSLLSEKIAIHINDTHPVLIIPELMRILIDDENLSWEEAWNITQKTVSFTNHTTLSEALEKWPVSMVKQLLPRIYMIIEEINERYCRELWSSYPYQWDKISSLAIVGNDEIRMAHLAVVASYSVNGVAKIHTDILKKKEMKDFYVLYPEKFNNKTNGITHRRWLLNANPRLTSTINEAIGTRWINNPKELTSLIKYSNDAAFQEKIATVKKENKERLANYIYETNGIKVNLDSIFDVQVKRLHAYKRQLLNVFHIIHLYQVLTDNPNVNITPRTFIFGGKAAPGYHYAKKIIKLINSVATVVNNDPTIQDKLKVVFLENYSVSLAEKIMPAADISEQISTASKEASGTGNMKFMMNGALTLGTLDGANIEICDFVGKENIFIFGLTADEVLQLSTENSYRARDIYNNDYRVKNVLDELMKDRLPGGESEFKDIYYSILSNNDEYFVLKDFDAYAEAHELVDQTYRDRKKWLSMSVTNIAHSGKFSSDRTIQEYATDIWKIRPRLS